MTTQPETVMAEALANAGVSPSPSPTKKKEKGRRHYRVSNTGAVNLERGPFVPLTVPADSPDDPSSPARKELRDRAHWFADEFQQDGRGRLGPVVHEALSPWGDHRVKFLFASGAELSLTLVPYGPKGASNERLFWPHGSMFGLTDATPEARQAVEEWREREHPDEGSGNDDYQEDTPS